MKKVGLGPLVKNGHVTLTARSMESAKMGNANAALDGKETIVP